MDGSGEQATKAGKALSELGAAKGGNARAKSLSREDRQEIARKAAQARWGVSHTGTAKETHAGILIIGEREIPCSVLGNGLRVLSTRGVNKAMGTKTTGTPRGEREGARHLPYFLASKRLKPFIPDDLMMRVMSPIEYRTMHGAVGFGHEATILPQICKVILDANRAGALKGRQKFMAESAEILLHGLATVGIVALVDEVTGYQADRAIDDLNKILQAYISEELRPWTRRFPNEFFKQLYRLRKWDYREGSNKRYRVVGKLVNELIYKQLPPGVLSSLKQRNPPNEKGYRTYKHHQLLTPDIGDDHLKNQLVEVVTLMRVSENQEDFERLFKKAFPTVHRVGQSAQIQIDYA